MDTDLDTLATALYVTTDDYLKAHPHLAPHRPTIGIAPQIADAELVALAVMQALLQYTSEHRWLRYARTHLITMFPDLPGQAGYNKRLRRLGTVMQAMMSLLAEQTGLSDDDLWVVDSTPVETGRSKETVKRSELAGYAQYGYCASHSRFFWGFRLHLITTVHGLPISFALTGAKADEREVLTGMLESLICR